MTEHTGSVSALQAESCEHARRALIVVDVQPDFMPGGPLACAEGDALLPGLCALLDADHFGHVVATQDWHPADHISFASRHPGWRPFESTTLYGEPQTLWPDHCLQGSRGAELHPALDWSRADAIIRKGTDRRVDSYSGFRHNIGPDGSRPSTGLAGWLNERGVTHVWVCGLAREVCVLWTAEDAVQAGFETRFLWSLTRPVSFDSDAATRQRLQRQGIDIIDADFMDPV
ncbi:nicotinamidase [Kushneria phosphatilytica]|uniref:nicotinamidase n=1 Tax=Kushneria phosphatilytica TaxID=657387 RepID=A0A1S1NS73_9GAMM|nr:nicotinamidase [Kushneria phosphatilytica]OHV07770.1 nicotinamidase [Kushneria phosphatilytica]QEL10273.1 nicotinamidase [Kushneria phosphatilytica]